jgi:hypothetical protein
MSKRILLTLATAIVVLAFASPVSAQFCGDVDASGNVNLVDLVSMIEYFCAAEPPATFHPEYADVDPFPGVNMSDLVYLTYYLFIGGPIPCQGGPAGDDLVPGGQVSLEYVAGSMGPSVVATGYPLSFRVRVTNNTEYDVMGISNGFTVYSPDGATVGAIELSSGSLWEELWYIEAWTWEPVASEPFGNVAFGIFPPGVPPDYDGVSYHINLEPFGAEDAGKTICFDSSFFGAAGTWMWAIDGQNTLKPSWDGPHCFTLEEASYFPGDVNQDGEINITDLYDVVSYMFEGGDPPAAMEACDVNGNCFGPDIADLTYLVSYMFAEGDMPVFSCAGPPAKLTSAGSPVTLYSSVEGGQTVISIASEVDLTGIQLELALNDAPRNVENIGNKNLEVVHGYSDGILRLGMFDMEAAADIKAGTHELLRIDGSGELISAAAADTRFNSITAQVAAAKGGSVPSHFSLAQNYPNPFNSATEIAFNLANPGHARLEIFDITGRSVSVLLDASLSAGDHTVHWDGTTADGSATASGVYFYRLTANGASDTRKMMYLK